MRKPHNIWTVLGIIATVIVIAYAVVIVLTVGQVAAR